MTLPHRITRPAKPAPRTREDVSTLIDRIAVIRATIAQHDAQRDDDIAQIKLFHEQAVAELKIEAEALTDHVQSYCEANRDALTNGGKLKEAAIGSGTVGWRKRPPSIIIEDADAAMAEIRSTGPTSFLRTTTTIDKQAMLKMPTVAAEIPGVRVEQGQVDFFIKTKG